MERSVKLVFCALSALPLPALAGCGGGGGSSPTPVTPLVPLPHSASAALPDGLTATVAEDRTNVPLGGTVTYTMTLTNNTAQPITFQPVRNDTFPYAGVGDELTISDSKATVAFPQGLQLGVATTGASTTLAPGKSVSGTVAVGSDKTQGHFSIAGPYTANVRFTVQTGPSVGGANPPVAIMTVGPLEVDAQ